MTSSQRKVLTGVLVAIVALCLCTISSLVTMELARISALGNNPNQKNYQIMTSPKDLLEVSKRPATEMVIVDMRDELDYELGHIDSSINLPFVDGSEIDNYLTSVDSSHKEIYLFCYSGSRSARAFNYLNDLGYKNLVYVKFGYEEFAEKIGSDFVPTTGPCDCKPWVAER